MLVIVIPLLFAVLGAFLYVLPANAKVAELGRIAYFVGLLWLVWQLASVRLHLLAG